MRKGLQELMARGDLLTIAAGLAIALAAFTLAQVIVGSLITPFISIFVGDPIFALNSFSIKGSEFRYGALIEAAIVFALVSGVVYLLVLEPYRQRQDDKRGGAQTRACPECTSSISVAARRCPHCTAVVQPDSA
jgi:large conductance mechanosensitive channel